MHHDWSQGVTGVLLEETVTLILVGYCLEIFLNSLKKPVKFQCGEGGAHKVPHLTEVPLAIDGGGRWFSSELCL